MPTCKFTKKSFTYFSSCILPSYFKNALRLLLPKEALKLCEQNFFQEIQAKRSVPPNIRLDEDVFKTSWSRQIYLPYSYVFRRRLQDVFKTSWSKPIYSSWLYVFNTFPRRLQDVFKTSSKRLQDVLQRYLQDFFKTYHRFKLLLLISLREVLQKRLSTEGFA